MPTKYLESVTVNDETYQFLDSTEHSIEVEEQSATGSAIVGDVTVAEPNYTPNGDVILTTSDVSLRNVSSAELHYLYVSDHKRLFIYGINLSSSDVNVSVPTEASFQGAGVKLVVK